MPGDTAWSKTAFVQAVEAAWDQLQAYVASLVEAQAVEKTDAEGWNIKDHLSHLVAWEQAVVLLFAGQPRYQTLGVEQAKLVGRAYDEINATVRRRWQSQPVRVVIEEHGRIHQALMSKIQALTDVDLQQPVKEFFPYDEPAPARRVADLILANTVAHYEEHLGYMKAMVG